MELEKNGVRIRNAEKKDAALLAACRRPTATAEDLADQKRHDHPEQEGHCRHGDGGACRIALEKGQYLACTRLIALCSH